MAANKQYKVDIYYSTYNRYYVEAGSKEEAFAKVKGMAINEADIMDNLEAWKEADTAEIEEYEKNENRHKN